MPIIDSQKFSKQDIQTVGLIFYGGKAMKDYASRQALLWQHLDAVMPLAGFRKKPKADQSYLRTSLTIIYKNAHYYFKKNDYIITRW